MRGADALAAPAVDAGIERETALPVEILDRRNAHLRLGIVILRHLHEVKGHGELRLRHADVLEEDMHGDRDDVEELRERDDGEHRERREEVHPPEHRVDGGHSGRGQKRREDAADIGVAVPRDGMRREAHAFEQESAHAEEQEQDGNRIAYS